MKSLFFAFAVAAATLMSGISAQAGTITGGFSFVNSPISFNPAPSTNQGYDSYVGVATFTPILIFNGTFDFLAGPPVPTGAQPVSFALSPTGAPAHLTIDFGDYGTFSGSFSGGFSATLTNFTATYAGSFVPGSAYSSFTASSTAALNLAFSYPGTGSSYSVTGTFDAQGAPAVPEPTSMAIFGLGALGIAARRFRRK